MIPEAAWCKECKCLDRHRWWCPELSEIEAGRTRMSQTQHDFGSKVIPDEAVEAAKPFLAIFMERRDFPLYGNDGVVLINCILKAAAPHLMRAAWDEGWEAHGDWGGPTPNPYRSSPV